MEWLAPSGGLTITPILTSATLGVIPRPHQPGGVAFGICPTRQEPVLVMVLSLRCVPFLVRLGSNSDFQMHLAHGVLERSRHLGVATVTNNLSDGLTSISWL